MEKKTKKLLILANASDCRATGVSGPHRVQREDEEDDWSA